MTSLFRLLCINDVYRLTHVARAATVLNRLTNQVAQNETRRYDNHVTLRTLAGDFLSPNPLSPIDSGMSFVKCFNALGMTHLCFGNHEANLNIEQLEERLNEVKGKLINSNIPSFDRPKLPTFDIVECGNKRLGIVAALSDEKSIFRERLFKGFEIENPINVIGQLRGKLVENYGCDHVIALTHQSIERDRELAQAVDLCAIIGGHEHSPFDEEVCGTRIVKAGTNIEAIGVLDILIKDESPLVVSYELVDVKGNSSDKEDPEIFNLVNDCMSLVEDLEQEVLYEAPDGGCISAVGTRFRQTDLGSILCDGIRAELKADAAIINGATIKASRDILDGRVSLARLQNALPFPTKIITVEMSGAVFQDAIRFSRRNGPWMEQKRGFLQVDSGVHITQETISGEYGEEILSPNNDEISSIGGEPFDPLKKYIVALPRNLLKGFANISPLVKFAREHPCNLPGGDVYVPALELVVRHFARRLWMTLGTFEEIDVDKNGVLSREEVKSRLSSVLSHQPSDVLLNHLIEAVDTDQDGNISKREFQRIKNKL